MSGDTYPSGSSPLLVTAGANSSIETITTERISTSGIPTMFIRIAMSDAACPTTTGAVPTVCLQADTGDFMDIPLTTPRARIFNKPGGFGGGGVEVGDALMQTEANNVYLVTILISQAGSTWKIQFKNNDA